jgi:pimeloyl-ACP methyl ester carboxylesterase
VRVRPLSIIVVVIAVLLATAAWYLYSPDKARGPLETQYAPPPSQFVEILGLRLHVRDTGPRDAPALLMVHGFGSSLHTWEPWALALEPTYRVVRLDLPSFGLTGADPTGDYSEARTHALLTALLDHLDIARATIIGYSMGGGIAWRYAVDHPDRIDRVVLISPEGFKPPGEERAETRKIPPMLKAMRYILPTPFLRMNIAPSYADEKKLTPEVVARYRDMLLAPGNRDAILARMLQMRRPDPEPLLRRLDKPVLLIWGEKDRLIPFTDSADYMRLLPHAQLAAMPDMGHAPQEEAPEASLGPLLAFLRR